MFIDKLTAKHVAKKHLGPQMKLWALVHCSTPTMPSWRGFFTFLCVSWNQMGCRHGFTQLKRSTKMSQTAHEPLCSRLKQKPGLLSSQFTTISALHGSIWKSRKSWAHLDLNSESVFWLIWCLMWLELLLEPLKWTLGAKSKNYIDIGDVLCSLKCG